MDFNLWREVSFPEEIALDKIVESGQCFRPKKISPSVYRFITKHSFLYCKQVSEKKLAFYVKEEEDWEKLWCPYFDIERNYREIEKKYPEDTFLRKSIAFGRGLRVLRQDPFEMLITFILSQRKSIPAIRSSVEKLCSAFGEKVYSAVEEEEIAFFPDAEALSSSFCQGCRGKGCRRELGSFRTGGERDGVTTGDSDGSARGRSEGCVLCCPLRLLPDGYFPGGRLDEADLGEEVSGKATL